MLMRFKRFVHTYLDISAPNHFATLILQTFLLLQFDLWTGHATDNLKISEQCGDTRPFSLTFWVKNEVSLVLNWFFRASTSLGTANFSFSFNFRTSPKVFCRLSFKSRSWSHRSSHFFKFGTTLELTNEENSRWATTKPSCVFCVAARALPKGGFLYRKTVWLITKGTVVTLLACCACSSFFSQGLAYIIEYYRVLGIARDIGIVYIYILRRFWLPGILRHISLSLLNSQCCHQLPTPDVTIPLISVSKQILLALCNLFNGCIVLISCYTSDILALSTKHVWMFPTLCSYFGPLVAA